MIMEQTSVFQEIIKDNFYNDYGNGLSFERARTQTTTYRRVYQTARGIKKHLWSKIHIKNLADTYW